MEKEIKQEYVTNEMIKEQMSKFKYIGNDGLLYSKTNKYALKDS